MFNHTFYLPDGSITYIFCNDDFRKLVRDKLGDEADAWLVELIDGYENYETIEGTV